MLTLILILFFNYLYIVHVWIIGINITFSTVTVTTTTSVAFTFTWSRATFISWGKFYFLFLHLGFLRYFKFIVNFCNLLIFAIIYNLPNLIIYFLIGCSIKFFSTLNKCFIWILRIFSFFNFKYQMNLTMLSFLIPWLNISNTVNTIV